jgi:hypothetical protein
MNYTVRPHVLPLLSCDMKRKRQVSDLPTVGLIIFWNDRHFAMRVFARALGQYIGVIA